MSNDTAIGCAIGFFLGFWTSVGATVLLNYIERSLAHDQARALAGQWSMHNLLESGKPDLVALRGATTTIHPSRWWKADSHVLRTEGTDPDGRTHQGFLAIDPRCPWRATRSVRYDDESLTAEQQIEIIDIDGKKSLRIPENRMRGLNEHVLRKLPGNA